MPPGNPEPEESADEAFARQFTLFNLSQTDSDRPQTCPSDPPVRKHPGGWAGTSDENARWWRLDNDERLAQKGSVLDDAEIDNQAEEMHRLRALYRTGKVWQMEKWIEDNGRVKEKIAKASGCLGETA